MLILYPVNPLSSLYERFLRIRRRKALCIAAFVLSEGKAAYHISIGFFAAAILCLVYLLFFPENRRQIRQFYDYLIFQLFGYNFNQGGIPKLQLGRIPMALPMAVGILISIVFDNMGIVEFY